MIEASLDQKLNSHVLIRSTLLNIICMNYWLLQQATLYSQLVTVAIAVAAIGMRIRRTALAYLVPR